MGVLANDSFNRANGGLGANWTTVSGRGNPTIVSNVVNPTLGGTDAGAFWSALTWPNDQYSQAAVVTADTANTNGGGAIVRAASAANTFYRARGRGPLGASATVDVFKCVAGTTTSLATGTVTVNSGDVVKITASGTSIKAFVNGVQVLTTQTDSAITSGSAGCYVFTPSGSTTTAAIDNWEGGDLTSGAAFVAEPPYVIGQAVRRAAYF